MEPGMYSYNPLRAEWTDILPANGCKLIGVQAITGAGKSSFVCELLRQLHKHTEKERLYYTYKDIIELRKQGYNVVPPPQNHVIYSNSKFYLEEINANLEKSVRTYEIELDELGLPNFDYKTVDLPYGAILVFDEAHGKINNRMWQNLSIWLLGMLTFHRHRNITIIFITQNISSIDISIRERLHEVLYITNRTEYPHKRKDSYFLWQLIRYSGTKDIIRMGLEGIIPENANFFPNIQFLECFSKENPHHYFDSREGRLKFLHKKLSFSYRLHPVAQPNASSIDEFNRKHSFATAKNDNKKRS